MNFGREISSMTVREEAARWFAILHRGVMTLEERAAYEQWLSDETHPPALAETQRVWDLLDTSRQSMLSACARDPGQPARRTMVACMCVVSFGILALSCAHTPFWTSLNWVSR